MVAEVLTKVTRNGRVTLPAAIRREANVEVGDIMAVRLEDERIVLVPKKLINKSQAYFWTRPWQEAEQEAGRDIAKGRVHTHKNVEDLIAALEQE